MRMIRILEVNQELLGIISDFLPDDFYEYEDEAYLKLRFVQEQTKKVFKFYE